MSCRACKAGGSLTLRYGLLADQVFQRRDALARHRMAQHIGIDPLADEDLIVLEALERLHHAARRLLGGGEVAHRGAVGGLLLAALIGQQRAPDHLLRPGDEAGGIAADIVAAGGRRDAADRKQHGGDGDGLRALHLLAHARQMAAGDMAGLVRQHADDLVRCFRLQQRAGVHEDALAVHDEGVERGIGDQHHADILLGEAGGRPDRPHIIAQQRLDLDVADDVRALLLLGRGRLHHERQRGREGTEMRGDAQRLARHAGGQSLGVVKPRRKHHASFGWGAGHTNRRMRQRCGNLQHVPTGTATDTT